MANPLHPNHSSTRVEQVGAHINIIIIIPLAPTKYGLNPFQEAWTKGDSLLKNVPFSHESFMLGFNSDMRFQMGQVPFQEVIINNK